MTITKEKNFISVVAYMYNNAEQCLTFFTKIGQQLYDNFDNYEVILINDGSSDSCLKKIKSGLQNNPYLKQVNIINMGKFQGIEAAINAGNDYAIGDFIYEFDTLIVDYDITLFIELYNKALDGYDIVAATPEKSNKLSSKLFYRLYNSTSREDKLYPETFRIISRRAWNRIKSLSISIPYRKALYLNCGLKKGKIVYKNPVYQKRSLSLAERKSRFSLAIDSLIIFTNLFERISLGISIFFVFFALCVLGYTVYIYFGGIKPVEGWAPIMGVLSVSFFGFFALMTVVLKYLSIILKMLFTHQSYLIESTEKLVMESKED